MTQMDHIFQGLPLVVLCALAAFVAGLGLGPHLYPAKEVCPRCTKKNGLDVGPPEDAPAYCSACGQPTTVPHCHECGATFKEG